MKINRVNCFSASCKVCKKATFVKKSILGDSIYLCDFIHKNHKEMYAEDCIGFRCKACDKIICDYCNRGNSIETYSK